MNKGRFYVLSGLEGSGKSTIVKMLYESLNNMGYKTIKTREPGGFENPIAEKIRDIIVNEEMCPETEMYLLCASRSEHVRKTIKPNLEKGINVISDRYIESSLAMQGFGRELGFNKVFMANQTAIDGLVPDIMFYINIPVELGLQRKQEQNELNKFEKEDIKFHKRIEYGYKEIIKNNKFNNNIVIDGKKSIDEVHNEILEKILIDLRGDK